MHRELERLHGPLPGQGIRVRDEGVRPERDQGLHRVGTSGEDGAIHIVHAHYAGHTWRAQRALGNAEPPGRLLPWEELPPHDRIDRGTGEQDVAAALIELAGEGV